MHREAHIGSSKTLSPLPLATAFPAGLQGRFLSLSSLLLSPFSRAGLTYRSLSVASEPSQECFARFRESPNGESPGGSWEFSLFFLSLPESRDALSCMVCASVPRSGVTSYGRTRLLGRSAHFCALVTRRDHWDKGDALLSAGDSQYPPFYGI